MATIEKTQLEITRNNVTLADFLSAVKRKCEERGMGFGVERDIFENPIHPSDSRYYVKDGKKICTIDGYTTELDAELAACRSETVKMKPLEFQTYFLAFDGTMYNEICEFTYLDDKRGSGYYFQASANPVAEEAAAPAAAA